MIRGDAPVVEDLLGALEDEDAERRARAAVLLGDAQSKRAVLPLIERLQDPELRVRNAAAEALGKLGDARAAQPLISTLVSFDDEAGVSFLRGPMSALIRLGPLAVDALIGALEHPQWPFRLVAADLLGDIGSERAVEPLTRALDDVDEDVASAAAGALGAADPVAGGEPLLRALLDDARPAVRLAAARSLRRFPDSWVVDRLSRELSSEDPGVRFRAAEALTALADSRSTDALVRGLADEDEDISDQCTLALIKVGPPAVEGLVAALSDQDSGVRANAAYALASIEDPRAGEALHQVLDRDEDATVRAWAAEGIRRLASRSSRYLQGDQGDGRTSTVGPSLRADLPAGWLYKESITLLNPAGTGNVIASSEPVDPALDTTRYAAAQGDLLKEEFSGYREHEFSAARVFGGRDGFLRTFDWQPPDGEQVTQIQIYYVEHGRGYTGTATCPSAWFERLGAELRQALLATRIETGRGPS